MEHFKDESRLLENDFTIKTWKEDFCFIVEGKRFYAAKNILAFTSPVFERMFQADFKEKDQNEMELPGKLSADMEEFLKCIYPTVRKDVTIDNAFQIIGLAEEYQVLELKSKCEDCFLRDVDEKCSVEKIFKLYNLACLYSLKTLSEKCMKLAANKSLAELDGANERNPIPLMEIQRKIISEMEIKQLETEKKVKNLLREQKKLMTLYKYHHAKLQKGERLGLDDFEDWEGTSEYIKMKPEKLSYKDTIHYCSISICEISLQLTLKINCDRFMLTVSVCKSDVQHF
ncbi:BTB and MATH domain-containing protein 36-like [Ruditapes philippinarum]|uniref:BTB and MATH domain-containing protein 36-like n=1 Tax=Ruditapes philippinarum TaxID=129788 RepID=UPI00295B7B61|nr:BTB and MATH domain-containing protein 36-like [Ruditapes philippinarum]